MSFSEQLKRRREALGMSRAMLAERLGVSVSAVSNYENDTSFPKENVLLQLFDALNAEPNQLFRDSYRGHDGAPNSAERALLEKYRALSPTGRQTVCSVLDALCDYHDKLTNAFSCENEPRMIPLYRSPAAAGFAAPVCGEDFDYIPAEGGVPHGADFGVHIQGDSMAPWIADGSIVYVNRAPLADGDVGIFCVDGTMLCKQYHRRSGQGTVCLFSLNRARADADVVFTPTSGRSLTCLGRVMLSHRPPLAAP